MLLFLIYVRVIIVQFAIKNQGFEKEMF